MSHLPFTLSVNNSYGRTNSLKENEETTFGSAKIQINVNGYNGNICLEDRRIQIPDIKELNLSCIYNSQANTGHHWQFAFGRQVISNNENISVVERDGKAVTYQYDEIQKCYVSTQYESSKAYLFIDNDKNYKRIDPKTRCVEIFNPEGQLITQIDEHGNETSYQYGSNELIEIVPPSGISYVINRTIENNNKKIEIIKQDGENKELLHTYLFGQKGELKESTTADHYKTIYTYDNNGLIKEVSQDDSSILHFEHDNTKLKTLSLGQDKNSYQFDYAVNQFTITGADDHKTQISYDNDLTHIKLQGDNEGKEYHYSGHGQINRLIHTDKSETVFQYEEKHGLLKSINYKNKTITEYHYRDVETLQPTLKSESISSVFTKESQSTYYVYEKTNKNISTLRYIIEASGLVTGFDVDEHGLVITTRQYIKTFFSYDPKNPPSLDEMNKWANLHVAEGRLVSFKRDKQGQVSVIKKYARLNEKGEGIETTDCYSETIIKRNAYGKVCEKKTKVSDDEERTNVYRYDHLGRKLTETVASNTPLAQSTNTVYDKETNTVTLPNGKQKIITTDSSGEIISITEQVDKEKRTTQFKLHPQEALVVEIDPLQNKTYHYHDEKKRPVIAVHSSGKVTETTYCAEYRYKIKKVYANPLDITVLAPKSHYFTTLFSNVNVPSLKQVKEGLTKISTKEDRETYQFYDLQDKLNFEVDEENYLTEYRYDYLGNLQHKIAYADKISLQELTALKTALGIDRKPDREHDKVISYFYKNDQLIAEQNEAGYVTEYSKDPGGRKSQCIYYATPNNTFNNFYEKIKPKEDKNNDGRHHYLYDALDRVTLEVNAEKNAILYTYNHLGLKKSVTRFVTLIDNIDTVNPEFIKNENDYFEKYDYDVLGRNITLEKSNGEKTENRYDVLGHCIHTEVYDIQTKPSDDGDLYRGSGTRYDLWGRKNKTLNPFVTQLIRKIDLSTDLSETDKLKFKQKYELELSDEDFYNEIGLKVKNRNAKGKNTYFYYNKNQELLLLIKPNGAVIEYTRNQFGEILTERQYYQPLPQEVFVNLQGGEFNESIVKLLQKNEKDIINTFMYDKRSQIINKVDGEGHITTYQYNAFQEQIEENRSVNKKEPTLTIKYQYSPLGQEINNTKIANGKTIIKQQSYDHYTGKLTDIIDPEGRHTKIEYDKLGREVKVKKLNDKNNFQTLSETQYDGLSRETFQKTNNAIRRKSYHQQQRTMSIKYDDIDGEVVVKSNVFGEPIEKQTITNGKTLHQKTTTHAPDGQISSNKDGMGNTTFIIRDELGNEYLRTKPNKTKIKLYRDDTNNIVKKETETKQESFVERYTPNAFGLNELTVGSDKVETKYDYDKCKQLIETVIDPNGLKLKKQYQYNGLGQETSKWEGDDKDYLKVQTVYDEFGREQENIVDPEGLSIKNTMVRDDSGNVIKETNAENYVDRYYYNKLNQLSFQLKEFKKDCFAVNEYTYTESGKIESVIKYNQPIKTDQVNDETKLAELSNLIKKEPNDAITHYFYDVKDREVFKLIYICKNGKFVTSVEEKEYDSADRVIKKTNYANYLAVGSIHPWNTQSVYFALNEIKDDKKDRYQVIFYDIASNPRIIIDEKGFVSERRFDEMNKETMQISYATPLNKEKYINSDLERVLHNLIGGHQDQINVKIYDGSSRVHFEISPNGKVTENTYNIHSQITEIRQFADKVHLKHDYTEICKQVSLLKANDEKDKVSSIHYNNLGHVIDVIDAHGSKDHYERNVLGNATLHTDRDLHTWTFTFDRANRLVEEKSPLTNVSEVKKDQEGKLLLNTIKTEVKKKIVYDKLNNAIEITEGEGLDEARAFHATYDNNKNLIGTRLDNITVDEPNDKKYLENKKLSTLPEVEKVITTEQVHDVRNNKIVDVDQAGNATFYLYDNADRLVFKLSPISVLSEGKVSYGVVAYHYNAFSEVDEEHRFGQTVSFVPEAYKSTGLDQSFVESLIVENKALDRVKKYDYASKDRLSKVITPEVNYFYEGRHGKAKPETRKSYDRFGNCIYDATLIAPNIWAEKYKWFNNNNKLIAVVDESNYLTFYEYDLNDNVIRQREYATALSVEFINKMSSFGEQLEKETSFFLPVSYAMLKNFIVPSDKDRVTEYEYDKLNQKKSEIKKNATAHSLELQVNVPPKLIANNKIDATQKWEYTPTQKLSAWVDQNGNKEHCFYDERNLLIGSSKLTFTAEAIKDVYYHRDIVDLTPVTIYKVNAHGQHTAVKKTELSKKKEAFVPVGTTRDEIENCVKQSSIPYYDLINYYDKRGHISLKQYADKHLLGYTYTNQGKKTRELQEVFTNIPNVGREYHVDEKRFTYDLSHNVIQQFICRDGILEGQNYCFYNAFNELCGLSEKSGLIDQIQMYQKANNNGRVWSTNAEKGINTINLHDLRGLLTLCIQSEKEDLSKINEDDIHDILSWRDDKVERYETRYDKCARPTDVNLRFTGSSLTAIPTQEAYRHYISDRWGNILVEQDSKGNQTINDYNFDNHLISSQAPEVDVMLDNQAIVKQKPITYYGYDIKGNEIGTTDGNGHTSVIVRTEAGHLYRRINGNGNYVENYFLNVDGLPLMILDAKGQVWQYKYNVMKEIESVTTPLGKTHRYECDTKGNRTVITYNDGSTWHFNYDVKNRVKERYTPSLHLTRLAYNRHNQMLKTELPDGTSLENSYDYFGNLEQHIDLHGRDYRGNVFGPHTRYITYNNLKLPIHTWALGGTTQPSVIVEENITYEPTDTTHSSPKVYHPLTRSTRANEDRYYDYKKAC